jgi:hypothetical protein
MPDRILYDSAMRLFDDLVTPEVLVGAEKGIWPDALWQAVEDAGYLDVLAEGASSMVEAVTILRAAGYHAAPIPLAETMLARWLRAACGVEALASELTIGPVEPADRLDIADTAVSGHAGYIPWGRGLVGDYLEYQAFDAGGLAPVLVEGFDDQLHPRGERDEFVGPGADRRLLEALVADLLDIFLRHDQPAAVALA